MTFPNHFNQRGNIPQGRWRRRLHEVIFEADTPAGKAFDLVLLASILLSLAAVMLESVRPIGIRHAGILHGVEWFFTILFTLEYLARILAVGRPRLYMRSFLGVVDLLAILPTYLSLILPGAHYLLVIRAIRLLRVFRVLKLVRYVGEGQVLILALKASRPKITVFLGAILTLVTIVGTLMYLIEGEAGGFTSIPQGIYWAVVTLTTVGYGDIVPGTTLGKFLAGFVMILGYGIIAVPTGIVTAELSNLRSGSLPTSQACPQCSREGHMSDSTHCRFCGAELNPRAYGEERA